MAVSKRTRFEVFKRDGFSCQYCGRTPPTVTLEVDHIIAIANGGEDRRDNLISACFDCNRGKSDVPLAAVPESLATRMEERRERAAQIKSYNKFLNKLRDQESADVRELGHYWFNKVYEEKNAWVFCEEQAGSIRTFLKHLTVAEIKTAIDIAYAAPRIKGTIFKYFCGVCWRTIKGDR